ncbi:hypothetical protein BaRGS_00016978, partial [Batillaria attramentaria]
TALENCYDVRCLKTTSRTKTNGDDPAARRDEVAPPLDRTPSAFGRITFLSAGNKMITVSVTPQKKYNHAHVTCCSVDVFLE